MEIVPSSSPVLLDGFCLQMPAAICSPQGMQTLQFAVLTTPTHIPQPRWDTSQFSNNVSADYGSFILAGILIDDGRSFKMSHHLVSNQDP